MDQAGAPEFSTLVSIAAVCVSIIIMGGLSIRFFGGQQWDVHGKHILITGGSQGLGLALAKLVASKGADVTICARSKDKLEKAVEQIKSSRASQSQQVAFVSADVSTFEGARQAVSDSTTSQIARIPDAVFCCAGGAKPGFFLEQEQSDFEHGFKTDYMTALSTAHAAASLFVRSGKTEAKIILVGSTLSFIGLVGYAQYAPMKWAIRGLAESLRSEFKLYKGLDVHCYFPGTILSPGYEEENKTKPAITVQIEGGDANGLTPAQCAKALLKGVQRGQFYITSDFDTELMRAGTATCGTVPGNNLILDRVKALICLIGVSSWRIFTADSAIEKHGREHRSKLKLSSDAS